MTRFKERYGDWAVVTGASSGIGQAFARQLAQIGLNIVLVSRTEQNLERVADDLTGRFGVQTRLLPLDLADRTERARLDAETADLDVGLLINNAAVEQRGAFVGHSVDEIRQVVELNATAPAELAQQFGWRFTQRGRGGIILVSGSIGYQAVPHLANYAATKAHQLHLAEALYYELRSHGVDVLGLSPGLTKTPMVGRLEQVISFGRVGMLQLRPEHVARTGLKQLGKRPSVVAGLQYKFFAFLTKRVLSRARGAWLFGTLVRIAFRDKALLQPPVGNRKSPRRADPSRREDETYALKDESTALIG